MAELEVGFAAAASQAAASDLFLAAEITGLPGHCWIRQVRLHITSPSTGQAVVQISLCAPGEISDVAVAAGTPLWARGLESTGGFRGVRYHVGGVSPGHPIESWTPWRVSSEGWRLLGVARFFSAPSAPASLFLSCLCVRAGQTEPWYRRLSGRAG
jgi:hypothetical protein